MAHVDHRHSDPALEARLRARVASGEFSSLDAVVEEAIREFILVEPPLEELRARVTTAISEIDRGMGIDLDADDLKRAGLQRLREPMK